jgi:cellulase
MDIWEANARATVYTPHTCSGTGSFLCSGDECGPDGVCDKAGCGLNPYRSGFRGYYGTGANMTVNTNEPFTVVTQFISSDGTDTGDLAEIRRLYIQGGTVIENHPEDVNATEPGTVTDEFCTDRADNYMRLGANKGMGESLKRGMVLIFSIWNSDGDFMSWLNSGEAGPCGPTEGNPADIVKANPDVSVTFSNIRWGEIGSTFDMESDTPAAIPGLVRASQQGAAGRNFGSAVGAVTAGLAAAVLLL